MKRFTYDTSPLTESSTEILPKPKVIAAKFYTNDKGIVRCPHCKLTFNNSNERDVALHRYYHDRIYKESKNGNIFATVEEAHKAYEKAEQIMWQTEDVITMQDAADVMIKAKWSLYYLLNILYNLHNGSVGSSKLTKEAYSYEFVEVNRDYFPEEIYETLLKKYDISQKKLDTKSESKPNKVMYFGDFVIGKEMSYAELKAAERKYKREEEENV